MAYVCTTNYHKLILMQATTERAMGGGFRRNSDSGLKLKNRCTGSTISRLISRCWMVSDSAGNTPPCTSEQPSVHLYTPLYTFCASPYTSVHLSAPPCILLQAGGMCGRGACMAGCVCVAGGMCGRGHAW